MALSGNRHDANACMCMRLQDANLSAESTPMQTGAVGARVANAAGRFSGAPVDLLRLRNARMSALCGCAYTAAPTLNATGGQGKQIQGRTDRPGLAPPPKRPPRGTHPGIRDQERCLSRRLCINKGKQ